MPVVLAVVVKLVELTELGPLGSPGFVRPTGPACDHSLNWLNYKSEIFGVVE